MKFEYYVIILFSSLALAIMQSFLCDSLLWRYYGYIIWVIIVIMGVIDANCNDKKEMNHLRD